MNGLQKRRLKGAPKTLLKKSAMSARSPTANVELRVWPTMVSTRQIKAARALLGWSQDDLAARCSIARRSLARLEAIDGRIRGRAQTAAQIVAALEAAGITFFGDENDEVGVKLNNMKWVDRLSGAAG
jgi:DNA-binding XRE family transcriptional regulator